MSEPIRLPRRPLSDDEIAARLQKCFEILYRAGLRAQQRQAEQRPELHLVPPPEPATPQQHPLDDAVGDSGEMKDPTHGDP
jgi:hypothetical protein